MRPVSWGRTVAVGWVLDLSGGMSPLGWGVAHTLVAALMTVALATFLYIRPRELGARRAREGMGRQSLQRHVDDRIKAEDSGGEEGSGHPLASTSPSESAVGSGEGK